MAAESFFEGRDIAGLEQVTTSYLLSRLAEAVPVSIAAALSEADDRVTLLSLLAIPDLLV